MRQAVGLSTVAIVVAAAAGTPAWAGPDAPTPGRARAGENAVIAAFIREKGIDYVRKQEALDNFKSWIVTRPGIERSGYIESVNDVDAKAVTLLWHGDTGWQSQIRAEGARRGITVSIEQRQYGLPEIDAATAQVWADAAAGKWTGFTISYIAGVADDYDGIVVHGQFTAGLKATAGAALDALAASTATETGVTVRVEAGEQATLDVATRSNDYAPFNSGGYMLGSSGHTCTSGFSIWLSGVTHTTTARHCTDSSYHARNGTASYGSGVRNSGDGGAKVLSATGSGLMFDGAWNNSTGYTKNVDSLADVGLNSSVCMSGGNSGIHCGIKVDNTRVSFNDGLGSFSTIHGTQQNSGQIASMQGDSGGPVITLAGSGRVHAVGMDQGHNLGVSSCGSVHDAGSNTCGRGIFFTSMRTIINSMSGSSLVTS